MIDLPKKFLEIVEGVAGRILGVALAVAVILICALQIEEIHKLGVINQIISWLAVAWICLMESLYVVLFVTTTSATVVIPPIPVVALRQPRLPGILRPIASLFWLAHFFFIIGLIYILHESAGKPSSLVGWLGVYSLAFLFHFLAYGYLLLIVTAFTKSTAIIETLWKYRVLVSLFIAILSTFAPFFLPIHRVQ